MFYVGQTVYSESTELPAIFLGRHYKKVKGDYEWSYNIFCEGDVVEDWEFCDLAPLINRSGNLYKGDFATNFLTGYLESESVDYGKVKGYLNEVYDKIKEDRIKVLSLNKE
jgi:hypothetical protein